MRLINADVLKHKIADMTKEYKERLDEDSEIDYFSDGVLTALFTVFEDIDNQPTAYDVDNVVAELEERTDFLKDCTKYGNKNAKQQAEAGQKLKEMESD